MIQFDVVRQECDYRCPLFAFMNTESGGEGNHSETGNSWIRGVRQKIQPHAKPCLDSEASQAVNPIPNPDPNPNQAPQMLLKEA